MIGGDETGSDTTSSAQLRGGAGGEIIWMGLGVGSGCGVVCELASRVLRGVVWMIVSMVRGAGGVVGCIFGASTWTAVVVTERGGGFRTLTWMATVDVR